MLNKSHVLSLSSVWDGNDADLIEKMLEFYSAIPPEPILDSTFNAGRFWAGSTRTVESMDIKPVREVTYECDNQAMPGVPSDRFGCVVYDPPHVGANGRDKSKKGFDRDYGAHVVALKAEKYTLSFLYPKFLEQAYRVLKQEGLLLAKITDQVNNHRSRWAHVDFINMAEAAGFTVCDLIVKIRNGPMMSSKWINSHHARKRHCFWIVCRKSKGCEK